MNQPTKDLFDESAMSFGEHLEVLRVHVIRAIIGLAIAVVICLLNGSRIVDIVRGPIDAALSRYTEIEVHDDTEGIRSWSDYAYEDWGFDVIFGKRNSSENGDEPEEEPVEEHPASLQVKVSVEELAAVLHRTDPERFPAVEKTPEPETPPTDADSDPVLASTDSPDAETPAEEESATVSLTLEAPEFAQFKATVENSKRAVTLNVQEAFLTYIKVSLISGLVLASPWIFYQLWLFIAAGLYPHEQRYVYIYGTMSLFLFLIGAVFCFYAVFPFVLKFLLSFNSALKINPQIRLSEWISFAIILPLMFGVSFQLPLVMLFLERINIFKATDYREKRRISILVIAIISMLLTPADPMSMMLMMLPLVALYELGIRLCEMTPAKTSPFAET